MQQQQMLPPPPQSFTIKCQCTAFRIGLPLTNKKKSKFSNLVLDPSTKTLTVIPLNSKNQQQTFELKKLRNIHQKFKSEGKVTFQFIEETQTTIKKPTEDAQGKKQRLSQIFVEAASVENLELMIRKILELKKSMKAQSKSLGKQSVNEKQHMTQDQKHSPQVKIPAKKQSYTIPQRFSQNLKSRKIDPLHFQRNISQYQKTKPMPTSSLKSNSTFNFSTPFTIQLLQLPSILLQKILEYTDLQLKHRLISKKFDVFTLKNLKTLTLRDQIDQPTFNKLAKYVPNIKCRLKNVRNLELIDVYDEPQLQKNRAKSLFFGQWKQISKKAITQLKGLRIHTLEIPYAIKFQLTALYGVRLRHFSLYSKQPVTTFNINVSDQSLSYILRNCQELESFALAFVGSWVFDQLGEKCKEKVKQLKEIRIGSLSENSKREQSWFKWHQYDNLKVLKVDRIIKGGVVRNDLRRTFTFPLYLQYLQIGPIVTQQTITNLPATLRYLKLSGQFYLNKHLTDIYLPYLRTLDLTDAPLIRPSVIDQLAQCNNLRIFTNWQRQDCEYWKQMAKQKGIEIVSIRNMIRK